MTVWLGDSNSPAAHDFFCAPYTTKPERFRDCPSGTTRFRFPPLGFTAPCADRLFVTGRKQKSCRTPLARRRLTSSGSAGVLAASQHNLWRKQKAAWLYPLVALPLAGAGDTGGRTKRLYLRCHPPTTRTIHVLIYFRHVLTSIINMCLMTHRHSNNVSRSLNTGLIQSPYNLRNKAPRTS